MDDPVQGTFLTMKSLLLRWSRMEDGVIKSVMSFLFFLLAGFGFLEGFHDAGSGMMLQN